MKYNILLPLVAYIGLGTTLFADPFYDDSTVGFQHPFPAIISYPYIGGAFALTSVEDNYVDFIFPFNSEKTDIDYTSAMFQAGYQHNRYLALEFRHWSSVSSGVYNTNSNHHSPNAYESFGAWGMYIKPTYPLSPQFSIYGLLGFTSVSVDGTQVGSEILHDRGDLSWGAGVSFDLSLHFAFFVDYVSLFDDRRDTLDTIQDTKVDTLNAGITYKF